MKKLLLIFLFGTIAYAQPNINPPLDLFVCQMDSGGGMSYFDLTFNDMVMLAGLNASEYNVTYHETQAEAVNAQNAISNPADYSSASNVIYARVTETANTTNYVVAAFNLVVSPLPVVPNLPAIEQCGSIFDLTTNSNLIEGSTDVSYHITLSDAEAGFNAIANPQSYVSETSALVWVRVSNNAGCYIIKEQQLIIIAGQFEVSVEFDAQTITFVAAPEGDYEYSLDGIYWQVSPNFYNIAYGTHTGQVKNICGTTVALTIELTPMTPTGSSEQSFTEGETLADLEVEAEKIQWYENDGEGVPDFPPHGPDRR